jgi:endonuclease/exonuclease/phosphatase family metal-dependent hydrolase
MRILSWNIYFDDESGKERYPLILDELLKLNSDIICLQEVTNDFLKVLKTGESLNHYTIFYDESCTSYQNIILYRVGIVSSGRLKLSSRMNRHAPYIRFKGGEHEFTLVNVHLESMFEDTQIRLDQLREIEDHFREVENLIICGDMNFGDKDQENTEVLKRYKLVAKDDTRATYDIEKNTLASITRFAEEGSRRLDKFVFRGEFNLKNYELYELSSSDHFPISVEISLV